MGTEDAIRAHAVTPDHRRAKQPAEDRQPRRAAIVNETDARRTAVAGLLRGLGFEPQLVLAGREPGDESDVVLVGRSGGDERSLAAIAAIARRAAAPVLALLRDYDGRYVDEAAKAGAFGYVVGLDRDHLQGAIQIALARYGEYSGLQEAFARRGLVERAKGVLMERRAIDEHEAFELLRSMARRTSRRVVDIAAAVLESHDLLQAEDAAEREYSS